MRCGPYSEQEKTSHDLVGNGQEMKHRPYDSVHFTVITIRSDYQSIYYL